MHSKYITFDRGQCHGNQSEIDLYSRFVHTHILQNLPSYGAILKEEDRFAEHLSLASGTFPQVAESTQPRSGSAGNAAFLNDISLYFLGMTIVSAYNLWERQIISHLQIQLEFNEVFTPIDFWRWETVISTLEEYGTPTSSLPSYNILHEMHLISCATKHGKGSSYHELSARGSFITQEPPSSLSDTFFGTPLLGVRIYPTHELVHNYIAAIRSFWDYSHWEKIGPRRYASR